MSTTPPAVYTPPKPSTDIIITGPEIPFSPNASASQQAVLLQRNDVLYIVIYSNKQNASVRFTFRYANAKSEIKEGMLFFNCAGFRNIFQVPLNECWLFSFTLQNTFNGGTGQWTYAQVYVGRQGVLIANPPVHSQIWQGWVRFNSANGWPWSPSEYETDGGGFIRSIQNAAPGAGADFAASPPTGSRWILLSAVAKLTTSAAAGNRQVNFTIDDGANVLWTSAQGAPQAASLAWTYTVAGLPTAPVQYGTQVLINLTVGLQMEQGYRFNSVTAGILAGDQWSTQQFNVLEYPVIDV